MESGTKAGEVEALLIEHFPSFLTMDAIDGGNLDLGDEQDEFTHAVWDMLDVEDAETDETAQSKLLELQKACAEQFGTTSNQGKLIQYFLEIIRERYW